MTEIQNPKQKKTIALNRFGICNLDFEIYLEFGAWDL
jgi:hypothetical protein